MNKILKKAFIVLGVISLLNCLLFAEEGNTSTEDSSKKNYMGWIDTSNKDVNAKIGNIRLNARTKLGTFNISVVDNNGKKYPVLYNGNEYASTGFYLKVNNKVYRLIAESNIKTAARKTTNGMQLNYSVKNVAEVFVDFKCIESVPGNGFDMIKITSTVTNAGPKKADLALKLVLDTVLGESGNAHFYTSTEVPVKSEVLYKTMKNEKWFVSKNDYAQMQILLDGGDITPPEMVALANYSTLEKNSWEPEMLSYRTFDTVLAYNNSAVGIIWPSKKISVNGRNTNSFYLAFGTDGDKPEGELYLAEKEKQKQIDVKNAVDNLAEGNKKAEPEKTALKDEAEEKADAQSISPAAADKKETAVEKIEPSVPVVKTEPVQKPVPEAKPAATEKTYEPEKTTVKKNPNSLSEKQLTPEYIQNLIDRITALEQNPDLASEDEIKLLNDELDAILQALM